MFDKNHGYPIILCPYVQVLKTAFQILGRIPSQVFHQEVGCHKIEACRKKEKDSANQQPCLIQAVSTAQALATSPPPVPAHDPPPPLSLPSLPSQSGSLPTPNHHLSSGSPPAGHQPGHQREQRDPRRGEP